MNISTANSVYPSVTNCGLWLAAPSWGFNQTITELNQSIVYVAQQGPIVNGVDSDMWFGTLDELKAYGYHTPAPVESPSPPPPAPPETPPTPVETPAPTEQGSGTNTEQPLPNLVNNVPTPPASGGTPAPEPKPAPGIVSTPTKEPVVPSASGSLGFFERIINWIKELI